jgi:hypothetical protein
MSNPGLGGICDAPQFVRAISVAPRWRVLVGSGKEAQEDATQFKDTSDSQEDRQSLKESRASATKPTGIKGMNFCSGVAL